MSPDATVCIDRRRRRARRTKHASAPLTKNLKKQLLSALDVEESDFDPDGSLIDYGLDSVQVMMLVTECAKLGVDVGFDGWRRSRP